MPIKVELWEEGKPQVDPSMAFEGIYQVRITLGNGLWITLMERTDDKGRINLYANSQLELQPKASNHIVISDSIDF